MPDGQQGGLQQQGQAGTVESGDERFQPPVAQEVDSPSAIDPRSSPWYFRLAPKLVRPAAYAATVIIGSLLIPAVTKQWSDRPQELGIKTSLVRDISELATDAVEDRLIKLSGATPEDQLIRAAWEDLQRAQGPEKQEAQRKLDTAYKEGIKADQKTVVGKYSELRVKGVVIKAQLQAYFPETNLANEWHAYVKAVENYRYLEGGDCGSRTRAIANLKAYLAVSGSGESISWEPLAGAPYSTARCPTSDRNAFMNSYESVAKELSLGHERLLREIMKADMAGFSSGWRDLIGDIL